MKKAPPTPFDLILAIAQNANTSYARGLVRNIRELLETGAAVEPWASAVQLARDLGSLGADESYYLLSILVEGVVGVATQHDATLLEFSAQMRSLEKQRGLAAGESFGLNDAPADWLAVNRLWDHRFQELQVALFNRIGEAGMARDLVLRPDEFDGRGSEGWSALLALPGVDDE